MGNYVGPCLSVSFFELGNLEPSPFSRVAMRYLFHDEEFELDRLTELGRTDSLVRRAASINLEKEGKDYSLRR